MGQNRGYWASEVSTRLTATPIFDVTMSHSFVAATRTITINVIAKALTTDTGNYNINVVISEDSISSTGPDGGSGNYQHSYLYNTPGQPYYQVGAVITAGSVWGLASPIYYHDDVVRAMLGGTWGTTGVVAFSHASGSTYTKTYTYVVPSASVLSHIKLTALVQKSNPTDPNDRAIANSIQAKLNINATGVPEIAVENMTLEVTPNPANSFINVKANVPNNALANIVISNTAGQTVYTGQYTATGNKLSESISLNNISGGLYFVNVSGEGFNSTQKVVVNK